MGTIIIMICLIVVVVAFILDIVDEFEDRVDPEEEICVNYQIANKCDRATAIAKIKVDALNSNNQALHKAAKKLN